MQSIVSGTPDPLAPATSTAVGSLIGPLLDFAVVSVQMRGSGCSGGAFDLFDLPTTYDGYDAIEAVAAQSWVKGGKVGMGGISFSGITQLFTAGTRPPHLAAVAPLSVTDDLYTGTGYPGGIFNSGFAKTWVVERMDDAKPAPAGGQQWARDLIKAGDKHCRANQKLRLQTQDALKIQKQNPFRTPSLFAHRSPGAWLKRDRVPDVPGRPVPGRADQRPLRGEPQVPERPARRVHLGPERRARRLARADARSPAGPSS